MTTPEQGTRVAQSILDEIVQAVLDNCDADENVADDHRLHELPEQILTQHVVSLMMDSMGDTRVRVRIAEGDVSLQYESDTGDWVTYHTDSRQLVVFGRLIKDFVLSH